MAEAPYDPLMGPWSVSDSTLWRRVRFGGRKGRAAERRLAERERRYGVHWTDEPLSETPWDYPRNYL